MMARREVIGASLVGALMPAGGGQQVPERVIEEIAAAVRDVRHTLEQQQDFHEIIPVRLRITDFLRAQMKFPDFLDVGSDVWYTMYDWHVRNVQPVVMNRDVQGRYTMQFMATTLVLRPDLVPNYIGTPYDNR